MALVTVVHVVRIL